MKKFTAKRVAFRLITLIPLITILGVVLFFVFFTNLPQLWYSNSIRNIPFDCLDFSSANYVYKLKPGPCHNKNLEYDVTYSADANGFRNTLRGSSDYEIAVIGDSFALGAGVGDEQTFSHLLESSHHFTTINLAMGSYATTRELEALAAYGKDAKYVIVQYCDNDFAENEASLKLSQEEFKSQVESIMKKIMASYQQGKSMGIGKPIRDLGVMLRNHTYSLKSTWRAQGKSSRPMDREAAAFAQVVARYRSLLEGKRVIVFETALWGANSPRFAETFGANLTKLGWLHYRLVNTAQVLDYGDYFFLDEHITADGHRKLAEALAKEITQWENTEPIIKNR